jgi:hypothetical protein
MQEVSDLSVETILRGDELLVLVVLLFALFLVSLKSSESDDSRQMTPLSLFSFTAVAHGFWSPTLSSSSSDERIIRLQPMSSRLPCRNLRVVQVTKEKLKQLQYESFFTRFQLES